MTTIDEATGYTPPETQEALDQLIKARLERERHHSRSWEDRAKRNAEDLATWRREARKWEARARQNLAVIRAHEQTIQRFINRLDDVLTDALEGEEEND